MGNVEILISIDKIGCKGALHLVLLTYIIFYKYSAPLVLKEIEYLVEVQSTLVFAAIVSIGNQRCRAPQYLSVNDLSE